MSPPGYVAAEAVALAAQGARFHLCKPTKAPWACPSCRQLVGERRAAAKLGDAEAVATIEAELVKVACGCWLTCPTQGKSYLDLPGKGEAQLEEGLAAGRLLGWAPASLGLLVLDFDPPPKLAATPAYMDLWLAALAVVYKTHPPAFAYRSLSQAPGKSHFAYDWDPDADGGENGKFALEVELPTGPFVLVGDVRCAHGYVALPPWGARAALKRTDAPAPPPAYERAADVRAKGGGMAVTPGRKTEARSAPQSGEKLNARYAARALAGMEADLRSEPGYQRMLAVTMKARGYVDHGADAVEWEGRLKAAFQAANPTCDAGLFDSAWDGAAGKSRPPAAAFSRPRERVADRPLLSERKVDPAAPTGFLDLERAAKSLEFLRKVFAHLGYDYRLNERSQKGELRDVRKHGADANPLVHWHQVTDELLARIRDDIPQYVRVWNKEKQDWRPWIWSIEMLRDKLRAWGADPVDPFRAWLLMLAPWDGVARLDGLLHDVFGADPDDPLAAWAGRAVFMGPVQRTIEIDGAPNTGPGSKLDEMPVLYGAQGIGKSTFVRYALPPEGHNELFTDQFDFADRAKEQVEALLGRVLVENGELAGLSHADVAKMKTAVVRTHMTGVRMSFKEHVRNFPRRDFIVGTTDKADCLPNDPAGNRRFVVVELPEGCDVEAYMNDCREQLWAEALRRYRNGERANLPRELKVRQAPRAEAHRTKDDSFEDVVRKLTARVAREDDWNYAEGVSLRWLAKETRADGKLMQDKEDRAYWEPRWPASRQSQARLVDALKNNGWTHDNTTRRTVEDPDGERAQIFRWFAPHVDSG